jgi:hypothetical protein
MTHDATLSRQGKAFREAEAMETGCPFRQNQPSAHRAGKDPRSPFFGRRCFNMKNIQNQNSPPL